jgi:hypothetical protein
VMTRRHPQGLAVVVATVSAAGIAAFAAALASLAGSHLGAGAGAGLVLFIAAMMLADRFPVPLEGLDAAGISLSFVFGVAAVVLFGWAGGLLAVVAAPAVGGRSTGGRRSGSPTTPPCTRSRPAPAGS